jgi:hypothetical protein
MHSNIIFFIHSQSIHAQTVQSIENSGDCERCMVREHTYIHVEWTMSRPHKRRRHDDDAHLCCSHASPLQPHPPSCCTQQKNVTSVQDIETNAALHYLNRRSTNLLVPSQPRRGAKQKPPVHIKRTRRPFLAWRVEHTGTLMWIIRTFRSWKKKNVMSSTGILVDWTTLPFVACCINPSAS